MSLVLGIDVSTTATKAILIDSHGRVRATASAEYPYATPRPLWSEQDPSLWWDAARSTIQRALADAGAGDAGGVQAVGLTG
ncbi:MAG: FGGY family carbohydrate kinase, partial [Acidimicrobiia bacterium]